PEKTLVGRCGLRLLARGICRQANRAEGGCSSQAFQKCSACGFHSLTLLSCRHPERAVGSRALSSAREQARRDLLRYFRRDRRLLAPTSQVHKKCRPLRKPQNPRSRFLAPAVALMITPTRKNRACRGPRQKRAPA